MVDRIYRSLESCHMVQSEHGRGKVGAATLESGGHHAGGVIGKWFLWCSHFKE